MDDRDELLQFCLSRAGERGMAQAAAMIFIAEQLQSIAVHLKYLGNGDAATSMGALEALGLVFQEGLSGLADAAARGNEDIAEAINRIKIPPSKA